MTDVLPSARYELASLGEQVADPSRAAMLLSLMDGSARPASELAGIAGVTPQTASSHLRRLVQGGLLVLERLGRHHYFRLSGEEVADALEAMALLRPPARKVRAPTPERVALTEARTCYLHLAGRFGVAWLDTLERRGLIHLSDGALASRAWIGPSAGLTWGDRWGRCSPGISSSAAGWPAGATPAPSASPAAARAALHSTSRFAGPDSCPRG